MTNSERLLNTIPEAARALSMGRATIYELIRDGELTVLKIGRSSRIATDDLEAFVERRRARISQEQS